MQYRIEGTTLPVVTVTLSPGQRIYSSAGGMSWMTQDVEMDTNTGGGLGKMFKRALSGESLFVVDYYVNRGEGEVAFSAEFPGKILDLDLADGQSVIVQKDAFMCADKSVDLDMHFRKRLGAGLFGGEGFILQRLTGPRQSLCQFRRRNPGQGVAAGRAAARGYRPRGNDRADRRFRCRDRARLQKHSARRRGSFPRNAAGTGQGLSADYADGQTGPEDRPVHAPGRRSRPKRRIECRCGSVVRRALVGSWRSDENCSKEILQQAVR